MEFVKSQPNAVINISYNQVSVFKYGLQNPFNDWLDDHILQGFSWRKDSVSFKTISESGDVDVYVQMKDAIDIFDNSIRAIIVPFDIEGKNGIEISSIADSISVEIPKGKYNLLFQTGKYASGNEWCLFIFIKTKKYITSILKADNEISKRDNFLMDAKPA